MLKEEVAFACNQCGAKAPVSDMKYNNTGDFLICHDCYTKEHTTIETTELPSLATERRAQSFSFAAANLSRVAYRCTSCNYKFTRKADAHFSGSCPYCSKKAVKPENPLPEEGEAPVDKSGFFDVDQLLL